MDIYEEAVADIEAAYDEKRDAVTEKYAERRIDPEERGTKKRPWKWGIGMGSTVGGAAGGGYAVLDLGWVAESANVLGPEAPPFVLAGGALVGGAAAGGAGYWLTDKAAEGTMTAKNGVLTGAEHVEKGYLGIRERAAKGTVKAASWAGIERVLGGNSEA